MARHACDGWLQTPTVFNLAVVAQWKMRNTRKRTEHAELLLSSAGIFPVCSALFRSLGAGRPEIQGSGKSPLIFAIGHCLRLSVNAQ